MSEGYERTPPSWAVAALDNVAYVELGQSPPSSTYNRNGEGLPFFQGKAEFGALYAVPVIWCSKPGKLASKDDILLSVRAPVGPTNLAPVDSCIGRGLAAIRPRRGVHLRFLLYAIRRFAMDLDSKGTGTTFKAVSGKIIREFLLPIAPEFEQVRIADELDELLSDLDAGVTALTGVREKLKQYRAAVLKAAVEGTLTAEWRQAHPDTEPADQLLQRILAERRRRWEESQLQKYKNAAKQPPKGWKEKYREPSPPSLEAAPSLPKGWSWINIDSTIAAPITNGISVKGSDSPPGIAALRLSAMTERGFDYTSRRYLPLQENDVSDLWIEPGDFFVSRGNGSKKLVGRGTLAQQTEDRVIFPDTMMRLRFVASVSGASWIPLIWQSSIVRTQIEKAAKTTAGIWKIAQPDLAKVTIPLPPVAEQIAIVEAVEDQLSVIDHLESDLEAKLKNAALLRQSILKAAFAGKLVPQDPRDEPASKLLERIAAERAVRVKQAKLAGKGKRRGRKKPLPRPPQSGERAG